MVFLRMHPLHHFFVGSAFDGRNSDTHWLRISLRCGLVPEPFVNAIDGPLPGDVTGMQTPMPVNHGAKFWTGVLVSAEYGCENCAGSCRKDADTCIFTMLTRGATHIHRRTQALAVAASRFYGQWCRTSKELPSYSVFGHLRRFRKVRLLSPQSLLEQSSSWPSLR
ncbi:hypothetical protein RB2395 [Rhodopirellula baltica SH 1]|uniref:Uncharacterized protein n=1 Tax=Rhodopirellula baltica (strain DSM 10527 / NCIMB 13988 / SH1) TaxID=243090 RepID=Q7UVW7_RHOBA|nr:hypothetical protein RB2395 [Rhodopirellula baltica SH 1]